MRARVMHISTVHEAHDARVFQKQCRTLAAAEYDVLLAARGTAEHMEEGIALRGVGQPSSRLLRMLWTTPKACLAALAERADLYHVHDPELLPWALLLKLAGRHVVYDAHEDYPRQILSKYWIPRALRPAIAQVVAMAEHVTTSCFDGVVAATEVIAERFPSRKTVTICNYPMLEEFDLTSATPYFQRPRNLVYVGGISESRGIHAMLQAMTLMPSGSDATLILAGRFAPAELEAQTAKHPAWKRTDYRGWCSRSEVASILGSARVGIVVLQPRANYVDSRPVKLFEYMAAGIPVVASDFPRWRRIVSSADCGLLVDPTDPRDVARAIQWLLENQDRGRTMGLNGRKAIEMRYNWQAEGARLLAFYDGVLRPSSRDVASTGES